MKLFRVETKIDDRHIYTTFDKRLMTSEELAQFLDYLTSKMPTSSFTVEVEYIPLQSEESVHEPAKPDTTA